MKECNQRACESVVELFEAHYGHVDDELRQQLVKRRFTAFRESLEGQGFQCDHYVCLPLLQLMSENDNK